MHLGEIKLVGITVRTNNAAEMNQNDAKIGPTTKKYFQENLSQKINNRKNPKKTYCVYTDYESDFTKDYTFFIGEEVTGFEKVISPFEALTIPKQNYIKFTDSGVMPAVCIDMWKAIWAMKPSDLGKGRSYLADFEVYDGQSFDDQITLDIYIGIKK